MRSILVPALLLASACDSARPIAVESPEPATEAGGSIAIVFTRATKGVIVAVDGRLVVDRAHTNRVDITGVTPGLTELMIAAGSGPARVERHVRVDVDPNRITTIPVAAPDPPSTGLTGALLSVFAVVVSRLLTDLLF